MRVTQRISSCARLLCLLTAAVATLDCSGRAAPSAANVDSKDARAEGQAGAGASLAGSGGAAPGGQSGAGGDGSSGMFCGIETCAPDSKCCPATGRCQRPDSSTGCPGISCAFPGDCAGPGCTATDPAPIDPNCCPDGLAYCQSNNSCYYPGCQNCCPPDIECNQQAECPDGFACCYSSRRCYNPLLDDCSSQPPKCASDGSCPGDMTCCAQHGLCYEPNCTDCCPSSCAPVTAHCSESLPCCNGACCSGVPVPRGQEYCAESGSQCPISDRNAKRDIVPVDSERLLEQVAELPISEWSYRTESSVRHIGPMAQDFHAAFSTGEGDTCIPTVDENGVALAAIQALYRRVVRLDENSRLLRTENAELRREVARLREKR